MYFGSYEHSLDAKGRLVIPSKYRNQLGTRVYITKGFDGCLSIYSETDFQKILESFASLSYNQASSRAHVRANISSTDEVEIDAQGRLQIPAKLLLREGFNKEVTIVGAIDHLELWDRQKWNEYYDNAYNEDESNAESLNK
ncbi:MAG: division/cell wall cluster transcriptional repressor MraZ [Bacilli bacterium]|nr:division/cell wall cluster transcriptional repressor MraZ [Bacilli bacterium]